MRTTSATAGAPPNQPEDTPYGLVTDLTVSGGTYSVVAMIGGAASIYLGSGGGYIGGGEGHEAIKRAAMNAVEVARGVANQMRATRDYPLPRPGYVQFYVLTRAGVTSASIAETALRNPSQPLSGLYEAVQDVITQYRLINT
ncbi:MAG: hypothetical protein WAK84_06220 [Candidatus Cybelea sp.]